MVEQGLHKNQGKEKMGNNLKIPALLSSCKMRKSVVGKFKIILLCN